MSNSWAYPILHTPDVDRALGVVRDLLELPTGGTSHGPGQ